jgi:hypothetical protein
LALCELAIYEGKTSSLYKKRQKKREFFLVKVRFEGLKNCTISKGISLECENCERCARVMLRHMVVIYDMLILLQCLDEVKG